MNENDAFSLGMLSGRLWVDMRGKSQGDTDLGYMQK